MTKTEIYDILIDNGWTIRKGVNDTAYKQLSDRQIQLIPGVRSLIDIYSIEISPTVSTIEFSKIVEYIGENKRPRKIVHSHIINSTHKDVQGIQVKIPTRQIIEDLLSKIEAWAQQQDLEAGIQEYCKLPTDSKGNLPLLHLSALAITGQVAKLEDYLEHFKQGDNIGFVAYIKQDYIERALEEARNHQ